MANATEQNQFDQAVRLIEPGDSVVVGPGAPSAMVRLWARLPPPVSPSPALTAVLAAALVSDAV
ncbi:hypothetical protein [Neisseria gonorrhoeae]|uniref:hypothetical protein n=1 Tax=Neisseria gonorrhoeae TaxID=485 RepID=UPI0021C0D5D8|nr:hypothetical protein [Neisseria gonorrhoeae]